jgi:pimeloyl-ACP methyl ester carboxylesterase
MLAKVEEVRFRAADGIELSGWLMPGRPDRGAIVLCHDFGGSKSSVTNVAIALVRHGFTVLAFDFRAHGGSDGAGSTLGLAEKRDVLGAVDYLASVPRGGAARIGAYGVGMGAYAAVLAARDRPALQVLVLDSVYPDVAYPLVRRVYDDWPFGVRHLGFLPRAYFRVTSGRGLSSERVADTLQALGGRDLLMVAPAADSGLAAEMERMYRTLPQEVDAEGNLVTLPVTAASGLYGEDLERYLARVCTYFLTRLAPST